MVSVLAGTARRRDRPSLVVLRISHLAWLLGDGKSDELSMLRLTSERYWSAPKVLVAFHKRFQVFGTGLFSSPTY